MLSIARTLNGSKYGSMQLPQQHNVSPQDHQRRRYC